MSYREAILTAFESAMASLPCSMPGALRDLISGYVALDDREQFACLLAFDGAQMLPVSIASNGNILIQRVRIHSMAALSNSWGTEGILAVMNADVSITIGLGYYGSLSYAPEVMSFNDAWAVIESQAFGQHYDVIRPAFEEKVYGRMSEYAMA
jgi:hypothetical protein